MPKSRFIGAGFVLAMFTSVPLNAQSETTDMSAVSSAAVSAENIRSLNIMLMVTSLRCRRGAHDFSNEYELFAQTHSQNIAFAHRQLVSKMAAEHGARGSERQLDRLGVQIANRYGEGHPTMDCSQLKDATTRLAMSQDRQQLSATASRLLGQSSRSAEAGAHEHRPAATVTYDKSVPLNDVPPWLRG